MTIPPETDLRDVSLAEALWRLGLLRSTQLPAVGLSLLSSGVDSRSLRMLAMTEPGDNDEAVSLFENMLKAFNTAEMSKRDAAMRYAKWVASQITAKRIDIFSGANLISDAALRVDDDSFHDLDALVYAASESEDRPEDREFFSSSLLTEALRLTDET
jgi:hypothetical protein